MSGQVQVRNDDLVTLLRSEFPRSPWGCAFLAYNSFTDANATGNAIVATIDFDTEVYDLGDDFAADTFTAPKGGVYLLSAAVYLDNLAAINTTGRLRIVTSNRTYFGLQGNYGAMRTAGNTMVAVGTCLADMDAADTATVDVTVWLGGQVVGIQGHAKTLYTYFCGHRVS